MASPTSLTIGPYVSGEIPPPLVYTFLDSTGAPINLSVGYTAQFSYREQESSSSTLTGATVTNAVAGQVTYVWTGAEFPTAGHYLMEFWTGNGTNRFASILLEADVRMPVGAVPAI
jgi:hypothetical protein